MKQKRVRLYANVAARVLGFGTVGLLLGLVLRGRPVPAAVTPGSWSRKGRWRDSSRRGR
jgi:hypothetical protein